MASKSDQAEKLLPILQQTCEKYPLHAGFPAAIVKVNEQNLFLFEKMFDLGGFVIFIDANVIQIDFRVVGPADALHDLQYPGPDHARRLHA